ncbi:MAG TPA: restriction endonuclease subunit S [Thermodesulfobacteriota bacterium]|nr:restriction endonuclease subunit S [Thermodesulfobacteriota bacterium]
MNQYSKYKDTGIDLIREIPEHWEITRLKRVTLLLYGESLSNENRTDGSVPVYGSNGITGYHDKAITTYPCIVIGRKGSFGKVNYSEGKCFPIDTTFYIDTTATSNDIRWLYYLLLSLKLDSFSKDSAVPGLNREEVYERIVPLPPPLEQNTIACYLDHKTNQIDILVEKKQKLIELLKEYRTAIINHAVTKGLNPNVKMKDSGIEWLGKIPEHWEVQPLKFLCEIVLGKMLTNDDRGEYLRKPYLRAQNITWEKVDTDDIKEMWFSQNELNQYRLKKNDLLVSEGGEVGRTALWRNELPECYIQNSVHKVTMHPEYNPYYYLYHFQAYGKTGFFEAIVNRVSIGHLTREKLKDIKFLSPPSSEQDEIAEYLQQKTQEIDSLIEKHNKSIEFLNEYRTSLISQVVTGKIDVRKSSDEQKRDSVN